MSDAFHSKILLFSLSLSFFFSFFPFFYSSNFLWFGKIGKKEVAHQLQFSLLGSSEAKFLSFSSLSLCFFLLKKKKRKEGEKSPQKRGMSSCYSEHTQQNEEEIFFREREGKKKRREERGRNKEKKEEEIKRRKRKKEREGKFENPLVSEVKIFSTRKKCISSCKKRSTPKRDESVLNGWNQGKEKK